MSGEILIGYDGSEDARAATVQAGGLFPGRRAVVANVWQSLAVVMLHTASIDTVPATMTDVAAELDQADVEHSQEVAEEGCGVARDAGLDPAPRSVEGEASAWYTLLKLADEIDAAAVVVGSRGLSGVKSMLLGSVSAGVLHHAARPVLVAPPPDRQSSDSTGRLLIAYDGSDHARRAIRSAGELLPGREARVVNVWLSAAAVAPSALLGAPAGVVASGLDKLDAELAAAAETTAGEGAALATEAGLTGAAAAVRAEGNVWATLAHLTDREHPAAVVLGSHGRSGAAEALLGSVSRGVAHHSSVPVLVVPPAP
jgi:nucleotide-binding universal stress UspA family protein